MKLLLVILSTFVFSTAAFSQFMINETLIAKLQGRQLIIEKNTFTEKELKKLGKDDELLAEQNELRIQLNDQLVETTTREWAYLDGKPLVMTPAEITGLKDKNKKEDRYAIISFRVLYPDFFNDLKSPLGVTYDKSRHRIETWQSNRLALHLIEEYDEEALVSEAVYAVNLPNIYPGDAEFTYGLQQLQTMLRMNSDGEKLKRGEVMDIIEENASALPEKTLLLAKEDIDPDKLNDEKLKANYPFPARIVPYAEIEKAILSKDPGVAYVLVLPVETSGNAPTSRVHMVFNAENGLPMGYSAPRFSMKGAGHKDYITPDTLKDYQQFVDDK